MVELMIELCLVFTNLQPRPLGGASSFAWFLPLELSRLGCCIKVPVDHRVASRWPSLTLAISRPVTHGIAVDRHWMKVAQMKILAIFLRRPSATVVNNAYTPANAADASHKQRDRTTDGVRKHGILPEENYMLGLDARPALSFSNLT